MPALRRSLLWSDPRIKPDYGVAEIDWSHPLSMGLGACWLFNERGGTELHDMTGLQRATITDLVNTSWLGFEPGIGLRYSVNLGGTLGVTISPAIATGTVWSWDAYLRPSSFSDDYGALFDDAPGAQGIYYRGGSGLMSLYDTADRLSTTAITPNTSHHYAITLTATTVDHYLDGQLNGAHTGLSGASMNIDAMFNDAASQSYAAYSAFVRFWTRQLSAGEALWLAAEPFAMFRPIVRRRWFVPAAVAPSARLMGRRVYILP